MKLTNAVCLVLVVSGLVHAQPVAVPAARVEAFSPQGEIKDVRQVVARFSEPMVAFGDPRLASPFEVKCEAKGNGHWVDARNWAYDFDADLPAGLRCRFTTRAKLTTQAGAPVTPGTFNFSTGGPAIRESWPDQGEEAIDERQVFLLGLDAMADPASVRERAYCKVAGVGERVPLELIEGDERNRILTEQEGRAQNVFQVITKRGRSGLLAVKDDRFRNAPIVVARCARKLPAGAEVSIVWGAGIRSAGAAADSVATSEDQTLPFMVREEFAAKQTCERVSPNAGCVPVLPLTLVFTAPVDAGLAAKIELRTASGKTLSPRLEANAKAVQSVSFPGPFEASSEVTITLPRSFKDDAGRELINAQSFPLKVRIDEDPPLVKFPSHFGILESKAQPALPVSVRNVEASMKGLQTQAAGASSGSAGEGNLARVDTEDDSQIAVWLNRVLRGPALSGAALDAFVKKHERYPREGELPLLFHNKSKGFKATPLTLPRIEGEKVLELVGIPLPKPGFYVVEFSSNRLGAALHGEKKPYYAYSSALVTNMAVHFKLGRESSLAWVTQLDNAAPVANARVTVSTCDGEPMWKGTTDAKGMARIGEALNTQYYGEQCSGLLVVARKDDDLSFMLSSWNDGISTWQFNFGGGSTAGRIAAHTVLDRPLFRAGETVSMKHFLRMRTGKGFAAPDSRPGKHAVLMHEGSGQSYDVPVSWNAGTGVSAWAIPKEARLGTYSITLQFGGESLQSGSFRVEQYRVPLMKAVLKPPAPVVKQTKIDVDAQLSYLAGGVAAGAPVKFRSRLVPYPLLFPAYDDFRFGGKVPQEGLSAVQPYAYNPSGDEDESDGEVDTGSAVNTGYAARTRSLSLDANGGARVSFDGIPQSEDPRALEVEMEYSDPNGQILTSATRVLVLPSSLALGIRMEGWYATKEKMSFKVLALDVSGKIQAGRKVTVDAYQRKTYAYRKRLLGGFYAYEETQEIKRVGTACSGTTDPRGILICDGSAPDTGELILVARAEDDKGNTAIASTEVYVAGEDAWFSASQSDRIDVLPDKRAYQPGETAHFEVRMPFREAMALVTVEREGVLSSMVLPISAKNPFVDVPIAREFGPNAYVSVMVVRGRVDPEAPGAFAWLRRMIYRIGMFFGLVKELPHETNTAPTALVDLTKPAFRLGMAQIKVGWQQYELKVKVEADRERYKVRDKAAVKVTVTDADGKPAANAEIALAAVDEGLLQLAAPTSWQLLDAMMQRRPAEVQTSTAQSQVIGKRHFGKKAAAPGGGGGGEGANAREMFDTLLLWRPSVQLDAKGEARIEVPLNDSLTSFRIEAIAHANTQQFGSASTRIRTSQEVMLFAGLPPFVREGDQFAAMLTVRNGGDRPLTLDVTASADAGTGARPVGTQRVSIKAGEADTVSFPATVPFDAKKLNWRFAATEVVTGNAAPAKDALSFVQTVGAAYPVRVYQQTLEQLEAGKPLSFPVQRPAGAIAGRGGVDIRLANSLGGELGSLREWMQRYPYSCLEQRASVAVALEDEKRWDSVMNGLPTYLDRDGLAKYFPMDWLQGDDTLTSYLLSIADEAGYEIPEGPRERMLKGLEDFVAGRIHRYGVLQTADVVMRKLAALDALARYERARPEMLQSFEIAPNLWPSSGVIDWVSLLTHMKNVPDRERKLDEARQILKSRLMFSGTTMSFSTEKSDYLWWLMVSPELNAIRMLRLAADEPGLAPADAGRLARGALGRQQQGRWQTTVSNAWGVIALRHFKERFERDPVAGASLLRLGDVERPLDWSKAASRNEGDPAQGTPIGDGVSAHFDWPDKTAPLSLQHQGSGKPWAFIASRAALPLDKPLFAGYQMKRTVTPVEQQKSGVWQRGDTYRVTLEIDAQADMTWVVVNDPVPAGASVLGSGLGGDSKQLASGEKKTGWQRPAFEERAFDGFRAYYQYVPKGKFSVEYTVRLNNPGSFLLPASRVEAMYAPEIFAEVPVAKMEVK
ncbi:alpha-2-macroglobulin [Uliginosibacterium paludis]|uniref:MG2 domain-containing protein n=1 Tax=Uliginosibacterium paludis TaxID=1615952 RepID=A0ABV2CVC4_9RHOO